MTYQITVDKEIVNLILNYDKLKIGYTPLNLKLKSKNFYATRIYEYLRKWSGNKNSLSIGLYQLKELLSLEGRYNTFKDFRKRVLDPSINEINEKFNMIVNFELIKAGNKTTGIKFNFIDNETRTYDFDSSEIKEVSYKEVDIVEQKLKESGFKIATLTINNLKKKYGENSLYNAIVIMCNNSKKAKITAPVKYLTGILENLNAKPVENIKQLKFNNFESRNYNYDALEKKLLGWEEEGENSSIYN
ncbi:hypothetical protein [Clostridium saccharoperbutylacetonicum]|uniref:hypothetical protein n=1 Tax=Clostridium saccharoperbutylacetonicum TaxID=36745 RepID=UPI0039EB7EA6